MSAHPSGALVAWQQHANPQGIQETIIQRLDLQGDPVGTAALIEVRPKTGDAADDGSRLDVRTFLPRPDGTAAVFSFSLYGVYAQELEGGVVSPTRKVEDVGDREWTFQVFEESAFSYQGEEWLAYDESRSTTPTDRSGARVYQAFRTDGACLYQSPMRR